jgi:hypothetical protein
LEDGLRGPKALQLLFFASFLLAAAVAGAQTITTRLTAVAEFDHMQPHGFDWMLDYKGNSTADFVKDSHFADLDKYVISVLKVKQDFDGTGTQVLLRDKFLAVLSGSGAGPRLRRRCGCGLADMSQPPIARAINARVVLFSGSIRWKALRCAC